MQPLRKRKKKRKPLPALAELQALIGGYTTGNSKVLRVLPAGGSDLTTMRGKLPVRPRRKLPDVPLIKSGDRLTFEGDRALVWKDGNLYGSYRWSEPLTKDAAPWQRGERVQTSLVGAGEVLTDADGRRLKKPKKTYERGGRGIGESKGEGGSIRSPGQMDVTGGKTTPEKGQSRSTKNSSDYPPGSRWITIHPHGSDEGGSGVPILIRQNPDGSASVIGGAGGSLNQLHLTKLRSPEEWKEAAADKKKQKKIDEKKRRAGLSDEDRKKEDDEKIKLKKHEQNSKQSNALQTLQTLQQYGVEHGLTDEHIEALKAPPVEGADVEDVKKWQALSGEAVRHAKKIQQAYEHKLVTDHEARAAAFLGDASLGDVGNAVIENREHVATDPDGNALSTITHLPSGDWVVRKSDPDAPDQVYGNWSEAAKAHVRNVVESEESINGSSPTQDENFYDPTQWIKQPPEEALPEGFTFKTEAAAAIARLSQERKEDSRNAKQAEKAIERGVPFAPGYDPGAVRDVTNQDLLEKLDSDAKTLTDAVTNNNFLNLVDQVGDMQKLKGHIFFGGYSKLSEIASDVLKLSPVSPALCDAIGYSEGAKVLAYQLRQTLSAEEYNVVARAQEALHAKTSTAIAQQVTDEVNPMLSQLKGLHDEIATLTQGIAEDESLDSDQQMLLDSLSYQAESLHQTITKRLGETTGQLQASAAMVMALKSKPNSLQFIGDGSVRSVADLVPRIWGQRSSDDDAPMSLFENYGMGEGDFDLKPAPDGQVIEIKESGLQKLAKFNFDAEDVKAYETAQAIKRGDFDEEGYLPPNFSSYSESTFTDIKLEKSNCGIDLQVKPGMGDDDIKRAIKNYLGELARTGEMNASRAREFINNWGFFNQSFGADGDRVQKLADDLVVELGGDRDEQGRFFFNGEKLNQGLKDLALSTSENPKTMTKDDSPSLHHQQLDEEIAMEAAHRSLATMPMARTAFKAIGETSGRERRWMREYAISEIMGEELQGKPVQAEGQPSTPAADDANSDQGDLFGGGGGGLFDVAEFQNAEPETAQQPKSKQDDLSVLERLIGGLERGKIGSQDIPRGTTEVNAALINQLIQTDPEYSTLPDYRKDQLHDELMGKYKNANLDRLEEHYAQMTAPESTTEQWQNFSKLMGGDRKAYAAIQEHLKGKFMTRFAKSYSVIHGQPVQFGVSEMSGGQQLALASLDPIKRARFQRKQRQKEAIDAAAGRKRTKGRFATEGEDWYADFMAVKSGGSRDQTSLFDAGLFAKEDEPEPGYSPSEDKLHRENERLTIGDAAENQLHNLMGKVMPGFEQLDSPVPLIPDVSWGKGSGHETKQRATKLIEERKKCGIHFGAGSGKTATMIGAFDALASQGKVKKAIVAVPSAILGQAVGECSTFLKPGKYKYSANIGFNREERIAALKDPDTHIHFTTRESLSNDLLHLVQKHTGVSPEDFSRDPGKRDSATGGPLPGHTSDQRHELMLTALKAEGIDPAGIMTAVDEAHDISVRRGVDASKRSLAIESLSRHTPYYVEMTGTPVKNDPSEYWSFLHRVDPEKWDDQTKFLAQYGSNSPATRRALQRAIAPYSYTASTRPKDKSGRELTMNEHLETVAPSPLQSQERQRVIKDYKTVADYYSRVSGEILAEMKDSEEYRSFTRKDFAGAWDEPEVKEAIERLASAETYGKMDDPAKMEAIGGMVMASAALKNTSLWRLYHRTDYEHNPKMQKTVAMCKDYVAQGKPGIVFSASSDAAARLQEQLAKEGIRVGVLDGSMNAEQKSRMIQRFSPANHADADVDVLVATDAAQTGVNATRGKFLVHLDIPLTQKAYDQRSARVHRLKQTEDTNIHTMMLDAPEDRIALARMQRKGQLGSIYQEKTDLLDDSGLAAEIERHRLMQGQGTTDPEQIAAA